MLGKDFNDTAPITVRFRVPLEVAMGMVKDCRQFITLEFIGRENSNILRIIDECLIEKAADSDHARSFRSHSHTVAFPVGDFERDESSVRLFPLSHTEILIFGNDSSDNLLWRPVFVEELSRFVGVKPLVQQGKLFVVGGCRGKRDLVSVERSFNNLVAQPLGSGPSLSSDRICYLALPWVCA